MELTGNEEVSFSGLEQDLQPNDLVQVRITYRTGESRLTEAKCRIDTEVEKTYVENGGVLHYVLRNLANSN